MCRSLIRLASSNLALGVGRCFIMTVCPEARRLEQLIILKAIVSDGGSNPSRTERLGSA